jgi:DNA-binding CsgD family transcriptional regulator
MLTKKESEVLKYIAQEFTNQEIAERLNCGIRTVDTHKRNLIKKLEVKNVVGLVKYAIKMGVAGD